MSTLRDLINKQRMEKSNVSSQQVVQPKAAEEKAPVTQETKPAERAVPQPTETVTQAQSGTELISTAVVEQGPPKGLSPLQLIKWRKDNGGTTKPTVQTPTQTKVPATDISGSIEKLIPNTEANLEARFEAAAKSASQTADAQKTNQGVVNLEELRRSLKYLAENIEQKELVAQVVRTIGGQLLASPELTPQMTNAEVDLIVRGLRRAYSIAARKKSEAKEAKQSKVKDFGELGAAFAAAGLNLKLK